jgi:vitamin B12 transporter
MSFNTSEAHKPLSYRMGRRQKQDKPEDLSPRTIAFGKKGTREFMVKHKRLTNNFFTIMNFKTFTGAVIMLLPLGAFAQAEPIDTTKNYEIEKAVVTASRMQLPLKSIPQKVEILDKSIINKSPNENLGEILKRRTNLDIIQYPGAMTTVGLRGFPATAHSRNYTLILIDGLPAGTNNLATIPSDFIEKVEIVKGPYSVMYGSDAMGGVINIISKKPAKEAQGGASVGAGNFGQTHFSGYASGGVTDKLLLSISYSRMEQTSDYQIGSKNILGITETEKNILDKKSYGDIMENSKFRISQFNGKIEYNINNKVKAGIFSSLMLSNDIETPGNYWHSYGKSKKEITRFSNYGEISYSEKNNLLLVSPYSSIQNESNYNNNDNEAFINSKEQIRQSGIKIGNTHTWGRFKWLAGLDYDLYDVKSERFSSKITPANPYRPDHSRGSLSLFTQLAYSYNKLFVSAGGRFNNITYILRENKLLGSEKKNSNYNNFNPSLGVKFEALPWMIIKGSFGSAFYVPDAYKSAGVYMIGKKKYVGNPDLKPESTSSFDFGINLGKAPLLNVDVTYFQNFYQNKIVNDNSQKDVTTYKNASNGNMSGIEFMASSNIASLWTKGSRLEFYGGLTWFINNTFEDVITKQTLYTRDVTANFGIVYDNYKGFEAGINSRYSGHRLENDWMTWDNLRPDIKSVHYYTKGGYTESDQILRHPSSLIFDAYAYYTIGGKFRVGITASNLLDENYTEKDGYNMPGRSVMGNISVRF